MKSIFIDRDQMEKKRVLAEENEYVLNEICVSEGGKTLYKIIGLGKVFTKYRSSDSTTGFFINSCDGLDDERKNFQYAYFEQISNKRGELL